MRSFTAPLGGQRRGEKLHLLSHAGESERGGGDWLCNRNDVTSGEDPGGNDITGGSSPVQNRRGHTGDVIKQRGEEEGDIWLPSKQTNLTIFS